MVLGAAGMLGRLVERLARDGALGTTPIQQLTLADICEPKPPSSPTFDIETVVADLAVPEAADGLLSSRPDVVFHLAAVVSGGAEADFERGYRVNLDGTRQLLEAARVIGDGYRPRVVDRGLRRAVAGRDRRRPLHHAAHELRDAESNRRAVALRLHAAGVRRRRRCPPADDLRASRAPNQAVSGFFSGIIREPLNGDIAVLPVSTSVRHWHASPRAAIGFFLHAAMIDGDALGDRRCRQCLECP